MWLKSLFSMHAGYLTYGDYTNRRFVARFKYSHQRKQVPGFKRFLMEKFTPSEYFSRLEAGESPMGILRSKGYNEPRPESINPTINIPAGA